MFRLYRFPPNNGGFIFSLDTKGIYNLSTIVNPTSIKIEAELTDEFKEKYCDKCSFLTTFENAKEIYFNQFPEKPQLPRWTEWEQFTTENKLCINPVKNFKNNKCFKGIPPITEFDYTHPTLILRTTNSLHVRSNTNAVNKSWYMYGVSKDRTRAAAFQFANVYNDGSICWGKVPKNYLSDHYKVYKQFFDSAFNSDLVPRYREIGNTSIVQTLSSYDFEASLNDSNVRRARELLYFKNAVLNVTSNKPEWGVLITDGSKFLNTVNKSYLWKNCTESQLTQKLVVATVKPTSNGYLLNCKNDLYYLHKLDHRQKPLFIGGKDEIF